MRVPGYRRHDLDVLDVGPDIDAVPDPAERAHRRHVHWGEFPFPVRSLCPRQGRNSLRLPPRNSRICCLNGSEIRSFFGGRRTSLPASQSEGPSGYGLANQEACSRASHCPAPSVQPAGPSAPTCDLSGPRPAPPSRAIIYRAWAHPRIAMGPLFCRRAPLRTGPPRPARPGPLQPLPGRSPGRAGPLAAA